MPAPPPKSSPQCSNLKTAQAHPCQSRCMHATYDFCHSIPFIDVNDRCQPDTRVLGETARQPCRQLYLDTGMCKRGPASKKQPTGSRYSAPIIVCSHPGVCSSASIRCACHRQSIGQCTRAADWTRWSILNWCTLVHTHQSQCAQLIKKWGRERPCHSAWMTAVQCNNLAKRQVLAGEASSRTQAKQNLNLCH